MARAWMPTGAELGEPSAKVRGRLPKFLSDRLLKIYIRFAHESPLLLAPQAGERWLCNQIMKLLLRCLKLLRVGRIDDKHNRVDGAAIALPH